GLGPGDRRTRGLTVDCRSRIHRDPGASSTTGTTTSARLTGAVASKNRRGDRPHQPDAPALKWRFLSSAPPGRGVASPDRNASPLLSVWRGLIQKPSRDFAFLNAAFSDSNRAFETYPF